MREPGPGFSDRGQYRRGNSVPCDSDFLAFRYPVQQSCQMSFRLERTYRFHVGFFQLV